MTKPRLVLIAFVAMVLIVVGYGYRTLTSSANGSITPVVLKPDTTDDSSERIKIDNQYASFTYPTKFTQIGVEKPVEPVLLNYNFTKQQIGSWQISIQISRIPTGNLADEGSYNFRNTTPGRYQKEQRVINGNKTTIFSDMTASTFAKTGYIQNKSLVASFTMSGGTTNNYEQLQTDFDALIGSWVWR